MPGYLLDMDIDNPVLHMDFAFDTLICGGISPESQQQGLLWHAVASCQGPQQ